MEPAHLLILGLTPFAALLTLLVVLKQPAVRSMPLAYLITLAIVSYAWKMPGEWLVGASLKGVAVAIEILMIILGALMLLFIMQKSGAILVIEDKLRRISPDRRVQAILIAWMFGAFLEGAAGFGTPQAIAAPLLAAIGFPPVAAVMASLVANSTPVSFGALGTPILVGLEASLEAIIPGSASAFALKTVLPVAIIHSIIGTLVPLAISCMITRFYGTKKSWAEGLEIWPFAIWAGLCFTIPYFISAISLGPEFPAIIGGAAGMIAIVWTSHKGFLLPKRHWVFSHERHAKKQKIPPIPLARAVVPYIILAALLAMTRITALPFDDILKSVTLGVPLGPVSHTFVPLFSPLMIFVAVCLLAIYSLQREASDMWLAIKYAIKKMLKPMIALTFATGMVQLLILSANNKSGLPSIPALIASAIGDTIGGWYLLIAPTIGAIGSFASGSNTVSNLLFAGLQYEAATRIGISAVIVVALQVVGGAIGNMIAVHNIIAASATVGIHGDEGIIIRRNLIPLISYVLIAGLLGAALAWINFA